MQFETVKRTTAGSRPSNRSKQTGQNVTRSGINSTRQNNPPVNSNGTTQPALQQTTSSTGSQYQTTAPHVPPPEGTQANATGQPKNVVQGWPSSQQAMKKLKRQIINSLTRKYGNSVSPQILQQIIKRVIKARLAQKRQQMTMSGNRLRQGTS